MTVYNYNNEGSYTQVNNPSLKIGDTLRFNRTGEGKTGTVIQWSPKVSGKYTIKCVGASGGATSDSGLGAIVTGVFDLVATDSLKILVGQQGIDIDGHSSGGGGGSFVTRIDNTPLIIAGGGGGKSHYNSVSAKGTNGKNINPSDNGGASGTLDGTGGAGGGGLKVNGHTGYDHSTGGLSFTNGGSGGTGYYNAHGGFGCGGGEGFSAGGGGGGYQGGRGGGNGSARPAEGGSSYNIGDKKTFAVNSVRAHGYIEIIMGAEIPTPNPPTDVHIRDNLVIDVSNPVEWQPSALPTLPDEVKLDDNKVYYKVELVRE